MELLAPGGNLESFIAAINAGADAIYLGGKSFSARAYSSNFTKEEIANLIKYAHIRDVKVYVTINTLLFEDEFFDAVEFATFLYQNDVDAILVQDLGFASYLHKTLPDLNLHASTQINCHNVIQAKSLMNLGFKRIVLAREVSLEEARKIKELGVEVELFVHGALCVSYSGNCLMSSFIGGRSGNRGRCAQPCRHHVEVVDENNSYKDYAISTKDLSTIEYIEEYKKAGIDSLKIEGRMKREEYVYQVVSSYRKVIDQIECDLKLEINNIKKLFNRQLTKGYVFEESRTKVLNQDTPSNLGTPLGEIIKVKNNFVYVKLIDEVHVGDGIKFLNANLDGMLLTRFSVNKDFVKSAKRGDIISFSRNNLTLTEGTKVNKTTDYLLNEKIQGMINIPKLVPLRLTLEGKINQPLVIKIRDHRENEIEYQSNFILEKANNNPTSKERIITQMKKVDEHPYFFEEINYEIDEGVFVPISLLNEARRTSLLMISKKRENFNHYLNKIEPYKCDLEEFYSHMTFVKVENESQYQEVKNYPYHIICMDEMSKDHEITFLRRISHQDTNLLLNNQMTSYYKEVDGEFTLLSHYGNVTNSYTLDLYFSKGYKVVFVSCECDKNRIYLMKESFYRRHNFYPNIGIHIYGYIDYMIMKSCPIATSFNMKNDHCQMCKKNKYYLNDHLNVKFPIVTNEDCTTRILSPRPISLTSKIDELSLLNINNYLIDFTIEGEEKVKEVIEAFINKKHVSNKDFFGHYLNKVE